MSCCIDNTNGTPAGQPEVASGSATIGAALTSVVVNHGMTGTPTVGQIQVTPSGNIGLATKFWVDTLTATQFTINVDLVPGGVGATFSWLGVIS